MSINSGTDRSSQKEKKKKKRQYITTAAVGGLVIVHRRLRLVPLLPYCNEEGGGGTWGTCSIVAPSTGAVSIDFVTSAPVWVWCGPQPGPVLFNPVIIIIIMVK